MPEIFNPEPIRLPQLLFLHTRSAGPGANNDNRNPEKHLRQISWTLADDFGKTWTACDHHLGDESSGVPRRNDVLANLLRSPIDDNGQLAAILFALHLDMFRSDVIVAHNLQYHIDAVNRECARLSLPFAAPFFPEKAKYIDLLKVGVNFCRLTGKSGSPKYPSLAELSECCLGKKYISENNTLKDIEITRSCYYFMKNQGLIK